MVSESKDWFVAECLEVAVVTQGRTLDELVANHMATIRRGQMSGEVAASVDPETAALMLIGTAQMTAQLRLAGTDADKLDRMSGLMIGAALGQLAPAGKDQHVEASEKAQYPRKETQLSGEEARTTWRWEVLALEPGERPLPALEVTLRRPAALAVVPETASNGHRPSNCTNAGLSRPQARAMLIG